MHSLRALIRRHRPLWLVLILAAFAVKALVPAGYMVASAPDRTLVLTICSTGMGEQKSMTIAVPGKMVEGHGDSGRSHADQPCAFAGHGDGATSPVDPVLLALALAFILLLGFAPAPHPTPSPFAFLRPPLRGPPSVA